MARHRRATHHPREASRPHHLSGQGETGHGPLPVPELEVPLPLSRAPAHLRSTIQGYWADGLDAHAIAERLSAHGVTIHDVLVERYLNPG